MQIDVVWFGVTILLAALIYFQASLPKFSLSNEFVPIGLAIGSIAVIIAGLVSPIESSSINLILVGLDFSAILLIIGVLHPVAKKIFNSIVLGVGAMIFLFVAIFLIY